MNRNETAWDSENSKSTKAEEASKLLIAMLMLKKKNSSRLSISPYSERTSVTIVPFAIYLSNV